MKKHWLCRLGLHSWKPLGIGGLWQPAMVNECRRCERRWVQDWFCDWYSDRPQEGWKEKP